MLLPTDAESFYGFAVHCLQSFVQGGYTSLQSNRDTSTLSLVDLTAVKPVSTCRASDLSTLPQSRATDVALRALARRFSRSRNCKNLSIQPCSP